MEHLTLETFKTKIFNWEKNKEWVFEGERPAIVDFYADWCAPCRMIAPILEELAQEYAGQLDIYKINTEKEPELAGIFGISSIPSVLLIPLNEKPQLSVGALPKTAFVDAIDRILLKRN